MRDISLLMASVLTTGQTTVPELPEKVPELPESTQQQLKQNQEASVVLSNQVTPPEFALADPMQTEPSYVLHSSQNVITPDLKLKHQNILKESRNKIQFKDSFTLTQEAQEIEKTSESVMIPSQAPASQQSNSEASQSSKPDLLPNLEQQQDIPNLIQNLEQGSDTDNTVNSDVAGNEFLESEESENSDVTDYIGIRT